MVGYIDIREQVEQLRTEGLVKNFYHLDAQGNDAKQIADIQDIINTPGKCDILIVASNTSEALTPIVEKACEVMPVVQFDRYAQTDCPVVSERTIGGYAFGISGAQFIVDNLPEGGNVLAFRILPGVDVLEQRWGAARKIFEENPQLNIIGVEFVAYDSFKASTVVSDYLAKYGTIDAVWMDAGGTAVTILEAFKDAGAPYPKVMVGEDQEDYLQYWKNNNLTAIAPTFPTFQWRTAVLVCCHVPAGRDRPAQLVSAPAGCRRSQSGSIHQYDHAPTALCTVRLRGYDQLSSILADTRHQQIRRRIHNFVI